MRSGWRNGRAVLAAVTVAALGACADEAPVVSQEEYDAEAIRLCERHGAELLTIEELEAQPISDAARAAFLAGELVPAARAIVRSLEGFGYPADKAAEYANAAFVTFEALDELQANAIGQIDRRRAGLIIARDDPFADLAAGIDAMDIPC